MLCIIIVNVRYETISESKIITLDSQTMGTSL